VPFGSGASPIRRARSGRGTPGPDAHPSFQAHGPGSTEGLKEGGRGILEFRFWTVLKWDIGIGWRRRKREQTEVRGRLLEGAGGVRVLGLGLETLRRCCGAAEQCQAWLDRSVSACSQAGPQHSFHHLFAPGRRARMRKRMVC